MRILLRLLLFNAMLLLSESSFGQQKPAVLKIKFEHPQRQASVVTFDNGTTMRRTWAIDSTTTRTDSAGLTIYTFALEKANQVQIMYFSDSTTLTFHHFYLRPSDVLACREQGGQFFFDGENNTVKFNRFLHEIGLLSQDSLQRKPLLRKVSDDIYIDFMRDKTEEMWQLYQTTQDTTNAAQNIYVKASLEAQQYNRIKYFLQTKDWTDEMFERIKDRIVRQNSVFVPNNERTYHIPFRILPYEEAVLSASYKSTLMDYLRNESVLQAPGIIERMITFYDMADKKLMNLPKTRETLILEYFGSNGFIIKDEEGLLLQRLEKDFPNASQLKKIRYAYWTNQKVKSGTLLPPVPLLTLEKMPTTLPKPNSKGILLLLWNTWEDSCQLALESVAPLAQKYDTNGTYFKTVCVRNSFDSWKEVVINKAPNMIPAAHFYADYPETTVWEGFFGKQRPLLVVIDKEGKYVESFSPFELERTKRWLEK